MISTKTNTGRSSRDRDNKSSYFGVTYRWRHRGKFQSRIYKHNKEYNLGLYDLASDAALAYDTACRLFNCVSTEPAASKKTCDETPAQGGGLMLLELEDAKYVFDWLDLSDNMMKESDALERLNFLTPSLFREARAKEISSRFQTEDENKCSFSTESLLKQKVRKEVLSVAKTAASSNPNVTILGKRAREFDFGPVSPRTEIKSRRKTKTKKTPPPTAPPTEKNQPNALPWPTQSPNFANPFLHLVLAQSTANMAVAPPPVSDATTNQSRKELLDRIAGSMELLRMEERKALLTRYRLDQQLQEYMSRWGGPGHDSNGINELTNLMIQNNIAVNQMMLPLPFGIGMPQVPALPVNNFSLTPPNEFFRNFYPSPLAVSSRGQEKFIQIHSPEQNLSENLSKAEPKISVESCEVSKDPSSPGPKSPLSDDSDFA
ncbi:hypothetical protein HJC23_012201 [Cyclotella cryptica]|uniref:AP2/ERF domain-containing protein n=1 Tax=Cyclotella cryptica TaxID=29204 RepID=A0ABD3PW60_9STRA|eukprot:CCRYP_011227-RA/>CCRYP_011227-RA protein AED:0.33 eAED:0.33 QI:662/1/1/1/0/0/3/310/431